jgi:hypothetical protein
VVVVVVVVEVGAMLRAKTAASDPGRRGSSPHGHTHALSP